MIKNIKQFFNITKNGDIVGNDKITYNTIENKKNRIYVEELFYLIVLNSKSRIELHSSALDAIFDLNASGNPWWLDETDFVIHNLHEKGNKLDNKISDTIIAIKDFSPRIYSICREYFDHEKNIRSSISSWLICPKEILEGQTGYSFPSIYIRSIENMKDNLDFIVEQMEDFKSEYFDTKK